jgi:hypothetical protein
VEPPAPLPVRRWRHALDASGPLNRIEDVPLGISHGVIPLDRAAAAADPHGAVVWICNNTDRKVRLARVRFPAWVAVSVDLSGPEAARRTVADVEAGIVLGPRDVLPLRVRPHLVRPRWRRQDVTLLDHQVVEVRSEQGWAWVELAELGYVAAVVLHLRAFVPAVRDGGPAVVAWAAASFALVALVLYLTSPSRAHRAVGRLLAPVAGSGWRRQVVRRLGLDPAQWLRPAGRRLYEATVGACVGGGLFLTSWGLWAAAVAGIRQGAPFATSGAGVALALCLYILGWVGFGAWWWQDYGLGPIAQGVLGAVRGAARATAAASRRPVPKAGPRPA